MIALLLALAPVVEPYFGNPLPRSTKLRVGPPPKETFHLDCDPNGWANTKDCQELVARWNRHCTADERIRETGEPLKCETGTREDAYCIWRSDGTVEAKNATCSDRKGERQ